MAILRSFTLMSGHDIDKQPGRRGGCLSIVLGKLLAALGSSAAIIRKFRRDISLQLTNLFWNS